MTREGRVSSSRSKKSRSTPVADREYRLKFAPLPDTVAPSGTLKPHAGSGAPSRAAGLSGGAFLGRAASVVIGSASRQGTGQGSTFQIPAAYSAIVRSLENFPEPATFNTAFFTQAS